MICWKSIIELLRNLNVGQGGKCQREHKRSPIVLEVNRIFWLNIFLLAVNSHLCARRSYLSFLLQDFSSSPPFILLLRPNIFQTDSIVQFYTNICWEEFLLQTYYLCSIYRFLFYFVLPKSYFIGKSLTTFYGCCEFVGFLIEHWILSFTSTLFSTGSWN